MTAGLPEAAPKTNDAPVEFEVTVAVLPNTEPDAALILVLLNNELVVVWGIPVVAPAKLHTKLGLEKQK